MHFSLARAIPSVKFSIEPAYQNSRIAAHIISIV
jgi:hypothetical protein